MKLSIYAKPEFIMVRLRKGYTLNRLAEIVGVTRQSMSQIERRTNGVGPENSKKILEALEVEFDDIFEIIPLEGGSQNRG